MDTPNKRPVVTNGRLTLVELREQAAEHRRDNPDLFEYQSPEAQEQTVCELVAKHRETAHRTLDAILDLLPTACLVASSGLEDGADGDGTELKMLALSRAARIDGFEEMLADVQQVFPAFREELGEHTQEMTEFLAALRGVRAGMDL